ncbi:RidA family protein [Xanthobacter variabilis]|uniref:RidA family protein n=1 Tax=Xanthobacter variabilis TaxID=3119932 RepID=UPI00374E3A01
MTIGISPAPMTERDLRRIGSGPRLSRAVVHGTTVYLSGQVPDRALEGIEAQTRDALATIDQLLAQAGTERARLIYVQIWLADIRDFATMNAIWEQWLEGAPPPARACTQAPLADHAYRVEIQAIAAL